MSNDFAVGATSAIPQVGGLNKKPNYLITLNEPNKKNFSYFITIDKPDLLQGLIQTKGIYSEFNEDHIINNLNEVLTNIKKELILEVMLPWHRIHSIRSLVFNAVKTSLTAK